MTDFGFGALSYGAANVGNLYRPLSDDQAHAVLEAAWNTGIRYFDTAPHYGLGLSERRLGDFLKTKPRDEYIVSTKVGRLLQANPEGLGQLDTANDFAVPAEMKRVWDFSADGIHRSLDESLTRLGLDSIDILYLHDPEKYDLALGISAAIPALAALRDEGLVSAIGVGSMSVAALLDSVHSDALDLLMVAGRFTLVEQPALAEVIPECRRRGVGVVNAAVFNSGLLASNNLGSQSRYEYGDVSSELLARTMEIAGICAQYDVELPAAALQYTLREPAVRTVVVGGSTPEQIRQNAERMTVPISDDMWLALAAKGLIPA
jgi:D-threo-aldose 1-dehydrogenase